MLYVVATPIGNLEDITLRALRVLKECDYILAEDTRHSQVLLNHYEIKNKLVSFHKFNEKGKESSVLNDLMNGKVVSLISDAGTPGISDPGFALIDACLDKEIKVVPIPGPCAVIAAISASGFESSPFQFLAFLPKKMGELKKVLYDALHYPGTTVCYESPHRLLAVLELLQEMAPDRLLCVGKELTKKFEETLRGTASILLAQWKNKEVKGEIVLLIKGEKERPLQEWSSLSFKEHVAQLEKESGLSRKEAIVAVAKLRQVSKREVYQNTLVIGQVPLSITRYPPGGGGT